MFPYDHTTPSDDAARAREQLEPVHVASLLRRLQAITLADQAASIALEVDESLHIAADEPSLMAALEGVLSCAVSGARGDRRVVVRCRAEESGVVIQVEDELELADYQTGSTLAEAKLRVEAMGGELASENHPGEGHVVALHFPLLRSKRAASSPPAGRRISGVVHAVGEPPPRKTGDGSF